VINNVGRTAHHGDQRVAATSTSTASVICAPIPQRGLYDQAGKYVFRAEGRRLVLFAA
jgi:hypothetical protein